MKDESEKAGLKLNIQNTKIMASGSISSVQFSRSVMSNSLRPHESQHARPPCPSPTPGVSSNSCPSSQWCHPAISSSVVPFSCPLPASESFPVSQLFASSGQSIGVPSLHGKQVGKQWKQWQTIFGGSEITADGDCCHEIKRHLLLGRKAITNLDSILKKQRPNFGSKGPSSQSYSVFSSHLWMWELDHNFWVLKNWCFWTVVLEKTPESRVPCTARKSNQSILKEISPEYSLEGLMLKLKLQYFGHLMQRLTHLKRPWCWERLKAGEEGDDRGWDGWMASPTQWTWVWISSGNWW